MAASRTHISTYVLSLSRKCRLIITLSCSPYQPNDFPNPTTVDPTRPKSAYNLQGAGFHGCPGVDFVAQTLPEVVRAVFRLPGLRRAPAPQGYCAEFALHQFDTDNAMYISSTGDVTPWPTSLQVAVSDLPVDGCGVSDVVSFCVVRQVMVFGYAACSRRLRPQ